MINLGFNVASPEKKIRVAIVVSHPIQHFVHLYKALAQYEALEIKVFYCSRIGVQPYFDKDMAVEIKWAADLLGGYAHEFLPEADEIARTGFRQVNNPSVIAALKRFSPDVVQLHGYAQLTLLRALVWCRLKRIPVLLWSDSSLLFRRSAWKEKVKKLLLPWLLKSFHGVLATGDNNAAYYRHYGVRPERIYRCPFTVDETALGQARMMRTEMRARMRAQYGLADDELVLLFVGKLAPWKRPKDLLDALDRAQERPGASVRLAAFFAGDGMLRKELEAFAQSRNLRAVFAGFVNVDVLPAVYAMADALVFPSDKEPYGLSAREAVCLGLPLIVSDQIGCVGATDAARPGINAIVYPATDVDALNAAVVSLAEDPLRRANMGEASLTIAREMGPDVSVAGFVAAVQGAGSKYGVKMSWSSQHAGH